MCGIFGCLRSSNIIISQEDFNASLVAGNIIVKPLDITCLIVRALNLLKNRGYDSCGIFLNTILNDKYLVKYGVATSSTKLDIS